MANLVARLNAQPISTRFRIRLATVRAVQVIQEATGIDLPAGARRASGLSDSCRAVAAMSKRGVDFFNDWIVERINPDAYPTENDPRARQYVRECLSDAAKLGISRPEIEEDVGNIKDRMIEEMELATDREIKDKS